MGTGLFLGITDETGPQCTEKQKHNFKKTNTDETNDKRANNRKQICDKLRKNGLSISKLIYYVQYSHGTYPSYTIPKDLQLRRCRIFINGPQKD